GAVHAGSGGSVDGVRRIRMGGAWIFGGIECADCGVCGKSCASRDVDWCAGVGCGDDLGFVPCTSPSCGARGVARRHVFGEVLALLAALVSAPVLSVLF